jgi:hypothetical protein
MGPSTVEYSLHRKREEDMVFQVTSRMRAVAVVAVRSLSDPLDVCRAFNVCFLPLMFFLRSRTMIMMTESSV